ncbi:glycosyltransferase family 2 protein [Candidatus Giovannonibacteria bacterium]|nr:glycosyltransferase family 2 protein [Candidatus Giovannonibacteria bacterium]
MNPPLVSAGLTTRNRAHLLPRAVESLLNQTHKNLEIIISNNGSADDTERVALAYAAKDSRIKYFKQDGKISGLKNLQFTVEQARGKYFMWACDDDYWEPQFVGKLAAVLEENPDYISAMSHFYERRIGGSEEEIKLRQHSYTNLSNKELYKVYLRARERPTFLFALYRSNVRKKMEIPHCFNGIYVFLQEAALAGKAYSVPEYLFTWTNDLRPTMVRHAEHHYNRSTVKPFAVTKYVFTLPFRLFFSKVIPFRRKFLIFGPWLRRAWTYKIKIAKDFLGVLRK